ncbi:tyrosine-type recombinase/integrase [Dactylosporangium sp. NPDC050688]|uniref:tyrosine-type recombinase/integrase n=1 Tax=Dactylosporangium sp. NPDC050688 TaxID=3157217 RepID=UPI0033D4F3F1
MTLTVVAAPAPASYAERLDAAVRAEFRVTVYRPAADNPVLGRPGPACRVPSCEGERGGRHGWCQPHRDAHAASGLDATAFLAVAQPRAVRRAAPPARCAAVGCTNLAATRGWCAPHYQKWHWRGRPAGFTTSAPPVPTIASCRVPHCEYPAAAATGAGLCTQHRRDWRRAGEPPVVRYVGTAAFYGAKGAYLLHGLPTLMTAELQYGLQRITDLAEGSYAPSVFNRVTAALRAVSGSRTSLLERPFTGWVSHLPAGRSQSLLRRIYDELRAVADDGVDEWAKDRWDLRRLGVHGPQTGRELRFDLIRQPWLRAAAKRWVRHNLSRNTSVGTVRHHVLAVRQFSTYLTQTGTAGSGAAQLTRAALEGFLSWIATDMPHPRTRNRRISAVKVLIQDCRRFDWAPIPATAVFYLDDFNRVPDAKPRALSEDVMRQLESPANLALLPDDGTRAVVVLLMRTGVRVGDLVRLPFDPISYDPANAAYLDFHMHKLRRDHRIPLDTTAEAVIRGQQHHVRSRWPDGCRWLFPGLSGNAAGHRHFAYATVRNRINAWVNQCRVIDGSGQPVHVTPHQFRHTLGTRMINDGVAQHVVQRLYGHESPQMTAVYARLTDQTLREEFDRWCGKRVNIHGHVVVHQPGDEAAWLKERLARAKQTLPNGYCGRPLQHACPHPNACLTCPDFLTDGQFLDQHREQLARTRDLIADGRTRGSLRIVEINQRVETNLACIIAKIEQLEHPS